jgi:YVTN family beta-propeller protein
VGLGRANHVAVVDVASRQVKGDVLVGKRAWGLALSRDGKRLYVANGLSDDMSIVDTGSLKATKTIKVGRVPHTVVVDD